MGKIIASWRELPTLVSFSRENMRIFWSLTVMGLSAAATYAEPATCEIGSDGIVAFSGPCEVTRQKNGDFSFKDGSGEISARTEGLSGGNPVGYARFTAFGSLFDGSIGRIYEGGYSQRNECLGNRSIEFCVFARDADAKSSQAPDDPLAKVLGDWACSDGFAFDLTENSYNGSPVESIEVFNDGAAFGVTLQDGSRFGLMDGDAPGTLVWTSPESGDFFFCSRAD